MHTFILIACTLLLIHTNAELCPILQCPPHHKAVQKKHHIPTTNGCGTGDFLIPASAMKYPFTKCCDQHDYDFQKCNVTFTDANTRFAKCLDRVCNEYEGDEEEREECRQQTVIAKMAVQFMGCKSYTESQIEACECVKIETADKKNDANKHKEKMPKAKENSPADHGKPHKTKADKTGEPKAALEDMQKMLSDLGANLNLDGMADDSLAGLHQLIKDQQAGIDKITNKITAKKSVAGKKDGSKKSGKSSATMAHGEL